MRLVAISITGRHRLIGVGPRASRTRVALTVSTLSSGGTPDERTLRVEVRGDGVGFDTTMRHPGHLGLHTMRDRAESIGASLTISSAPEK